jgi:hypothetical protein
MASLLYQLPDVITNRYHPLRGAFQNLCHLPPADAERIIRDIRDATGSYRSPNYLARRMLVETWLIAERMRKLGETPLSRPVYFFLGRIAEDLDQTRPASILVPLAAFEPTMLTFTLTDSMTACLDTNRVTITADKHGGQVYTLPEIENMVHRYGFPNPSLPRRVRGPNSFIEVQVWDSRPLTRYLSHIGS